MVFRKPSTLGHPWSQCPWSDDLIPEAGCSACVKAVWRCQITLRTQHHAIWAYVVKSASPNGLWELGIKIFPRPLASSFSSRISIAKPFFDRHVLEKSCTLNFDTLNPGSPGLLLQHQFYKCSYLTALQWRTTSNSYASHPASVFCHREDGQQPLASTGCVWAGGGMPLFKSIFSLIILWVWVFKVKFP